MYGLQTPEQWCNILGAEILDPDGWRYDKTPWDEPITKEEFDERFLRSTVRLDKYAPPQLGLPPRTSVSDECNTCSCPGNRCWRGLRPEKTSDERD